MESTEKHHEATFVVFIEGKEHTLSQEIITVQEIACLGGWELSVGVIEIDHDNNERTLGAEEKIDLKHHHSYGKKHRWKRG